MWLCSCTWKINVHFNVWATQWYFCYYSLCVCGGGGQWVSGFPPFPSPSSILLGSSPTVPLFRSFGLLKLLSSENFCFTMLTHLANLLRRIFCQWSCISLTNLVKLPHADSLSSTPSSESTDNCSTAQFHWPLSTNWWIWQLYKKNKINIYSLITTILLTIVADLSVTTNQDITNKTSACNSNYTEYYIHWLFLAVCNFWLQGRIFPTIQSLGNIIFQ